MNKGLPRYLHFSILGAVILSALMLILYAYLGTFTRMVADDYCSVFRGLEYGVIEGVIERYLHWSSRYSSFFVEYGLAPQRPMIHVWMPFITIVVWLVVSHYIFIQLTSWTKISQNLKVSIMVALFITFSMYSLMPLDQHIFWFVAIISYNWIFILSLVFFGSFIQYFSIERSQIKTIAMAIYVVTMVFFLSGLSEIQIPLMITIFTLMLFVIPIIPKVRRREYIILVSACIISTLIALIIVLIAPGPKIRQDFLLANVPEASLFSLLFEGGKLTLFYMFGELSGIPFGNTYSLAYLASIYCTFLFGGLVFIQKYHNVQFIAPQSLKKSALAVVVIMFILIASTTLPMYYASRTLPFRSLIFPRFIQLCTVVVLAYLTLVAFQRHEWLPSLEETRTWPFVMIIVSIMIILSPAISIGRYLSYIPDFQDYAKSWDERHERLLSAEDGSYVIVEPLEYDIEDHLGLEKMGDDPTFWINNCAASYYGLEGIEVQN